MNDINMKLRILVVVFSRQNLENSKGHYSERNIFGVVPLFN
jgi:hypothetical protein